MQEQENINIVMQGYTAFGEGNIQGLLDTFDEDIEWRPSQIEGSPLDETYKGRQGVARFFEQIGEIESFSRFEPQEFIAQGDKVVVIGTFAATINETGREYQSDWVHVYTIRDGKVTNFREFLDTAAVSKALQKSAGA